MLMVLVYLINIKFLLHYFFKFQNKICIKYFLEISFLNQIIYKKHIITKKLLKATFTI